MTEVAPGHFVACHLYAAETAETVEPAKPAESGESCEQ